MKPRPLFVLSAVLSTLAGCSTPEKQASTTKKVEYVYYTPTGSNIPVKVRKDESQMTDAETAQEQGLMRDIQLKGRHPTNDAGTGGPKGN